MNMNIYLLLSANEKSRICDNLGLSLNEYATVSYVSNTCNTLGKPKDIYNVKGDGNCLFRALSFAVCGKEENHRYLRDVLTTFMCETKEGIAICKLRDARVPQKYIQTSRMADDGVWGTEVEIQAASSFFNVPIFVYTKYGVKYDWLEFKPTNVRKSKGAIYLHHRNEDHYDVVVSVENNIEMAQVRVIISFLHHVLFK